MNLSDVSRVLIITFVVFVIAFVVARFLKRRLQPSSDSLLQRMDLVLSIAASMMALVIAIASLPRAGTGSTLTVRVANDDNASVAGAKLLLFYPGGAVSTHSDSNGVATSPFRLKVQQSPVCS